LESCKVVEGRREKGKRKEIWKVDGRPGGLETGSVERSRRSGNGEEMMMTERMIIIIIKIQREKGQDRTGQKRKEKEREGGRDGRAWVEEEDGYLGR
jgi:hypothetical protein